MCQQGCSSPGWFDQEADAGMLLLLLQQHIRAPQLVGVQGRRGEPAVR